MSTARQQYCDYAKIGSGHSGKLWRIVDKKKQHMGWREINRGGKPNTYCSKILREYAPGSSKYSDFTTTPHTSAQTSTVSFFPLISVCALCWPDDSLQC